MPISLHFSQLPGQDPVYRLFDSAVEDVVLVFDNLSRGALVILVSDPDEAVAMVPSVFGHVARGIVRPLRAVALIVIQVGIRAVVGELIVRAGSRRDRISRVAAHTKWPIFRRIVAIPQ